MHFRNVPCSVDPADPRNPFNILRRIYKPGDYVAFKLVSWPLVRLKPHQKLRSEVYIKLHAICWSEHWPAP